MSKVVYFPAIVGAVLEVKINAWLLEHPGYRVAAMSLVKSSGGDCDALIAFETV